MEGTLKITVYLYTYSDKLCIIPFRITIINIKHSKDLNIKKSS